MSIASLFLSMIATIVSVVTLYLTMFRSGFNQSTSVIAIPFKYSLPASDSYLVVDAVTINRSSVPFAITSAHLWIQTRPMITGSVDNQTRLPEQNYYSIIPSFSMWRDKTNGKLDEDHRTTTLPVVVPANSAVHYRIAIATPNVFLWPEFRDGITITLNTSRTGKSINITGQEIRPRLQKLETYMKEPRKTFEVDTHGKNK